MLEPTMTIAGKAEAGQETFPVLNPANGQVIGNAPECTADLLDAAVAERARGTRILDRRSGRAIIGLARHCRETRE